MNLLLLCVLDYIIITINLRGQACPSRPFERFHTAPKLHQCKMNYSTQVHKTSHVN